MSRPPTRKLKPAGKGRIAIDSGAAESVLPVGMLPGEETVEGESKRKVVRYVVANGGKMENHGEKRARFRRNGFEAVNSITFQVTGVSKPLASVSRILDKGNTVVFSRSDQALEFEGELEAEAGQRNPVKVQDPQLPSEEEVRCHELTHLPYLSWCSLREGEGQGHRPPETEQRPEDSRGAR